jgi:hypothetical protein
MLKRIGFLAFALLLSATGLELFQSVVTTGAPSVAHPAEARVGRPLTPVSVAGVGRRTVRRCAAGVYYC